MKNAVVTTNPLYSPETVLSYVGREDVLSYARDTSSSASSSNDEKVIAEEDEGQENEKDEKNNGLATVQPIDPELEAELIAKGKKKVKLHKQLMTAFIFSANFILIFASWMWAKYYYLYLPFICMPVALNVIMIFNICIWKIKNLIFKPKYIIPESPETMVLLMPCYNETFEECTRSLDSLVNQVNIDHHKKAIMVICDGKVRGPGMEKSTGQYLNEDILVDQTERKMMKGAYVAWDGQMMDIEISKGYYKGIPFFCIVKQQNQGKRDSLIVIRSFVYKFNRRHEEPKVIFTPEFFSEMSDWLVDDGEMDNVDHLIGMDADTVFAEDCISHLLVESRHPGTIGVCGYVAVDWSVAKSNWDLWSIYQSAEYTIAQGLRRLHQSLVTHKVSCLPGCCQLLKVCDETCGDKVLVEDFGYHPKHTDGLLKQIRATASEDRNHVCLMLMEFRHAKTRQALKARAYTDVPHTTAVFLSQRRRWTLGATSNDLMLLTSSPITFNLFERAVALSNVVTWTLNFFVIASLACMVNAFIHQPLWVTMAFASIMFVPITYYLVMSIWLPRNRLERCQFLVGLAIFVTCGPFINVSVSLYAIFNMDSFGWGKTRQVIAEDDGEPFDPPFPQYPAAPDDPAARAAGHPDAVGLRRGSIPASMPWVGNGVADEENQLDQVRMPYFAPVGSRVGSVASMARRRNSSIAGPRRRRSTVVRMPARVGSIATQDRLQERRWSR